MPASCKAHRDDSRSFQRANHPRRVAGRQAEGSQIAGDDAARTDDTPVTDRNPGQHDRSAADPHATADADRPRVFEPGGAGGAVERMRRGIELNRRRHLQVVADLYRRAIEEDAIVIDETAMPETDVVA